MRSCCAIAALIATAAAGADFEYRAGFVSGPHARALVLEDSRKRVAIFAEVDFAVTRAVSDLVAAKLLTAAELDRAGLVLAGRGSGAPQPPELLDTIGRAMADLAPARVFWGGGVLSVIAADGTCVATIHPIAAQGCAGGSPVPSAIRSSFQLVDLTHGLLQRGEIAQTYPVQAIALGRVVTVLALGGEVPAKRFRAPGRLVIPFANDAAPLPADPRVEAAIARALSRVQ
jgi:hypothetical protein